MLLIFMRLPGLLVLLLISGNAFSAEENSPARAARMPEVRSVLDVPYVANATERQKLDLYLPAAGGPPRPLIIWLHGGGWHAGDRKYFPDLDLVNHGYVLAGVDYRWSKDAPFPAQIQDCKAAIRWLRAHAKEYGIDPQRIGVWGRSAGGHLACLLGTSGGTKEFDVGENLDQPSTVQCVVDWFGPTSFVDLADSRKENDRGRPILTELMGFPIASNLAKAGAASAITYVSKASAPTLIIHGADDPLVPIRQSQLFYDALKQAGVPTTLVVVPGAKHGGNEFGTPERMAQIEAFLGSHLHP